MKEYRRPGLVQQVCGDRTATDWDLPDSRLSSPRCTSCERLSLVDISNKLFQTRTSSGFRMSITPWQGGNYQARCLNPDRSIYLPFAQASSTKPLYNPRDSPLSLSQLQSRASIVYVKRIRSLTPRNSQAGSAPPSCFIVRASTAIVQCNLETMANGGVFSAPRQPPGTGSGGLPCCLR